MKIGLADSFGERTLLLLGDETSFNWLASQFEAREPIDLGSSTSIEKINVELEIGPAVNGSLRGNGTSFIWQLSMQEAREFATQLRSLAISDTAAHAYLDPEENNTGVQILASKGEYNVDTVFARPHPTMAPSEPE